jgi:PleD family two-component response regulator
MQVESGDDTPEKTLKRADIALYQAKQQGRNRIVVAK